MTKEEVLLKIQDIQRVKDGTEKDAAKYSAFGF
jgi:hypothetical protein